VSELKEETMATAGGNQDLLFVLGNEALRSVDGLTTHWAVQRRHPDGRRWLEVGRFPHKDVARVAMEALVANGHGEDHEFRVKKVTRTEP
jgi:hypothetical protein